MFVPAVLLFCLLPPICDLGFFIPFPNHNIQAVDKAVEIVDRFNELDLINRFIKVNVPSVVFSSLEVRCPIFEVLRQ